MNNSMNDKRLYDGKFGNSLLKTPASFHIEKERNRQEIKLLRGLREIKKNTTKEDEEKRKRRRKLKPNWCYKSLNSCYVYYGSGGL